MGNMKTKYFAIVDKKTREVVACISDCGQENIVRKDFGLKVYEGTEPLSYTHSTPERQRRVED